MSGTLTLGLYQPGALRSAVPYFSDDPNQSVRIGRFFGALSSELPPDDDQARLMSPGFAQPRFRPTGLAGTSGASNTTTGRATTARSRLRASCQSQRQPQCTRPALPCLGGRAIVITRTLKRDLSPRPIWLGPASSHKAAEDRRHGRPNGLSTAGSTEPSVASVARSAADP